MLVAYKTYKLTDKASFLHMEFIRDNYSRLIKIIKPDLIHYHGTALAAMHFANSKANIPILYSPHAMVWVNEENGVSSDNPVIIAAKTTLSFGDYFTALNESVAQRLKKVGVNDDKITIVPNGVDSSKFYYSELARSELRKTMGVSDNTIVFITVGLVIDRKGQFDFLKVLQSLDIDYQYWIIGKGPDCEKIEQYVKEEGIQPKVKLFGYVQDTEIYKYHSASDFYSHASYFEAQALSEIEAYSCGLRVIVNKVIEDTVVGDVKSDTTNYFVADFDNISRSDFVAWIRQETDKRVSRKQYDWQYVADKYVMVYNKLVQKK